MTRPHGASIVCTSAQRRSDVLHPPAEDAIDADQHAIARLDEVDEGRLHPGRPGAADGQRHFVLRAENLLKPPADLVHQLEKHRIEMADGWLGHRQKHAGRHVARARAKQHTLRYADGSHRSIVIAFVVGRKTVYHEGTKTRRKRRKDAVAFFRCARHRISTLHFFVASCLRGETLFFAFNTAAPSARRRVANRRGKRRERCRWRRRYRSGRSGSR